MVLEYILGATGIIALISLVGALTLYFSRKLITKLVSILIAFAAGTLLAAAFLDLLPEAAAEGSPVFLMTFIGILVFFVMETYLYWYHCHAGHYHEHEHEKKVHPIKPVGVLNLIGDSIHNFIDGMMVASAFLVSIPLGITTAIGAASHEIPQEIGDFTILLYSGYKRGKALLLNFFVATTVILGGITTYYLGHLFTFLPKYIVPFSAGGFIYMACADLLPDLKTAGTIKKATLQLIALLIGVALIVSVKFFFPE
jgi:zinc and cadmium transporter